jgi:multidrug efflux pump subunit AcrB
MLTGTLITAATFLPVGLAKSDAGEYVFSLFAVVGLALILSWIVAVVFTPFLGYKLLPEKPFTTSSMMSTTSPSTSASAPCWNGACTTARP